MPGAVADVAADEAGSTSADVTWTAPSTGGSPTAYRITPYAGTTALAATMAAAPATKKKIVGLTPGTTYTFTVQPLNDSGGGPTSAPSNPVTPTEPIAPGAPADVIARAATKSVLVGWTAPENDGESPITGYTVTPYAGGEALDPVQAPATATSRTVTGLANGTAYTFRVSATNAVGTGPASAASTPVTPWYTLLEHATPPTADGGDPGAVELGVRFSADRPGTVTGVRFYKAAANTGTHTGSLWTAGGTRLAQATFTDESATGWQTATFATPVALTPGTSYVASYHAPNGHYSVTPQGLGGGLDNAPLHALAGGNGVYAYGSASQFPTGSFNATNYWVDPTFAGDPPPGAPTAVTATAGQASASVSWTAPQSGGAPESYEVIPYAGSAAQTSKTVTGPTTTITGLTPGTAYTFRVRGINVEGTGPLSDPSGPVTPTSSSVPSAPTAVTASPDSEAVVVRWTAPESDGGSPLTTYSVTPYVGGTAQADVSVSAPATRATVTGLTAGTSYTFRVRAHNAQGAGADSAETAAAVPLRSIFGFAAPATVDGGDPGAVELGVRFQSSADGTIDGVRFYKAAANTGTHVGSLWTAAGDLLAEASFSGESASGWQTVLFATPVPITAGTSYIAGYHAPSGHYSLTGSAFNGASISQPAADRARGRRLRQRPLPLHGHPRAPHLELQRGQLLRRRPLRSKRVRLRTLLAGAAILGLTACGSAAEPQTGAPGSPDNPLVAKPSSLEKVTGESDQPNFKALVEGQRKAPVQRDRANPCALVTKAQAQASLGTRLLDPLVAPQGPTCIFRDRSGKSFATIALQPVAVDRLRRQTHRLKAVVVADRKAYCGVNGSPVLYLPVAGGRTLSVTAQCEIAKRLASHAVPRLNR